MKAIFVKIVQINENIEDKELKKIDEIYFKLTGNNLSKKNIYNQILNINNIEPMEGYLRKSIKLLNMIQKINILHAVEEFVVADGINLINGDELLSKLKK